jgi:hypothetical protein
MSLVRRVSRHVALARAGKPITDSACRRTAAGTMNGGVTNSRARVIHRAGNTYSRRGHRRGQGRGARRGPAQRHDDSCQAGPRWVFLVTARSRSAGRPKISSEKCGVSRHTVGWRDPDLTSRPPPPVRCGRTCRAGGTSLVRHRATPPLRRRARRFPPEAASEHACGHGMRGLAPFQRPQESAGLALLPGALEVVRRA